MLPALRDAMLTLSRRRWVVALAVFAAMAFSGAGAYADGGAGSVTVSSIVDPTSLASGVATIGGALFVAAIGVVLGFRVGKKAITWVSSKI